MHPKEPRQKINPLPARPGVYLFRDREGAILYVGKAANIRQRVRTYFQGSKRDLRGWALLEKVADIDYLITHTEKEAFLLENNLIKEHRPRYNVRLKDDKNYPLLRLDLEEEYPTLSFVRRMERDGALYFGPYSAAASVRETLRLIRRLFPIRTSLDSSYNRRLGAAGEVGDRPWEKMTPGEYREVANQVILFLQGKNQDLIHRLEKRMAEEAERLNFETAARIRDRLEHIRKVIEEQKIVSADFADQDAVGIFRGEARATIFLLFVRGGKLLGGKGFLFPSADLPEEELVDGFLRQFYRPGTYMPEQILLPRPIPEKSLAEGELSNRGGRRVKIVIPEEGAKRHLVELAGENAKSFLFSTLGEEARREELLGGLQKELHLRNLPRRIEAFDISNLLGGQAVGSMVVFEQGEPARNRYRRFRIRTVQGADDYGMMQEVLTVRYEKALAAGDLPDLVLVDGGKGQLNAAREVFRRLGIRELDLLALAKEKDREDREKVFHFQFKAPLILDRSSPVLRFLDRIRDEAHRFAVAYHQKVRGREAVRSVLAEIPGIGRARQRELLTYFGEVERIRAASEEELSRAPKMNRRAAGEVYRFFHPET